LNFTTASSPSLEQLESMYSHVRISATRIHSESGKCEAKSRFGKYWNLCKTYGLEF